MAKRRKSLTLDELIDGLVQIRLKSPLKGETVAHICIPGHEYQAVNEVKLTDTDAGDENNPSGVVLIMSDTLDAIVEDLDMEATLDELELEDEEDGLSDFDRRLRAEIASQEAIDPADALLHREPAHDDIADGSEPWIEATLESLMGLPKPMGEDDVRVVLTVYPTGKQYLYGGETGKPTEEHGGYTFEQDRKAYVEAVQEDINHNLGDYLDYLVKYPALYPFIGTKRPVVTGK